MYLFFYFIFIDLRTAFDLLDTNRDGRVTANELQFMLKKLGIDLRDELIEDLMKEASHTGEFLKYNYVYNFYNKLFRNFDERKF